MFKACGKCGKIHSYDHNCYIGKMYKGGIERTLRNKHKWRVKAKEIMKASNWLCAVCADKGIYNYTDLEVHHIVKLREDPEKLLDNYNLICLCRNHHRQADNDEIDKNFLFKLAKAREEK